MELLLKVISPQRHEMGQNEMRVFQPSGGTIGRASQNDWVLPDKNRHLSSKHATITYEQGAYFITDTSTNGVYLNNSSEPLGRGHTVRLQHGDHIQVADFVIETELLQDASLVPTSSLSAETRGDDLNGLITPQKTQVELDPLASFSEQSSSSLYSFSTDASIDQNQQPFDPLDGFIGAGGAQSDHDSVLDSSFIAPTPVGTDPLSNDIGIPGYPPPQPPTAEPSSSAPSPQAHQDLLAGFGADGLGSTPLQSSPASSPAIGEMGKTPLTNDPYIASSSQHNNSEQPLIPDGFLQGGNNQANPGYPGPGAMESSAVTAESQPQGPNFLQEDITPPGFDAEHVDLGSEQAQSNPVNSQGPLIPDDFMSEQSAVNTSHQAQTVNEIPAIKSDTGLIPDDFLADFGPAIDSSEAAPRVVDEKAKSEEKSEVTWGNHRATEDSPLPDHDQPLFANDFSASNEASDLPNQSLKQSGEEPLVADNPEQVISGDDILAAFEAPSAAEPMSSKSAKADVSASQDAFNVVPAGQKAFPKPRPPRPRRGQSGAQRPKAQPIASQERPQPELQKPVRVKVEQQYEAKSNVSAAMPVSQQEQPRTQPDSSASQTATSTKQTDAPQQPTMPAIPVKPDKAFNQLLLQLGINPKDVPAEQYNQLPATLGKVIHKTIEGLIRLMMTRANLKNEFRMSMTMIRTQENNPLKFCVSADQAIKQMLVNPLQGYLDTESAVEEAFLDFDKHQLAVMAATRSALNHMLSRLDPERLEQRFDDSKSKGMSFGNKRARYWEAYKEFYRDILEEENVFQALFGNEFASAYEEQINKLNQDN